MIAYDEFETFRTPTKTRVARATPERVEALDDLHRALYGSLHPAAAIVESDRELVEGEGEMPTWLEKNYALTAAVALVGAFAVYTWMKKPKELPLHGPPDVPFTPTSSSTP